MRQENYSPKREQLLSQCYDYNLPVSSGDSIETLENYLKAVMDEAVVSDTNEENEYFFLENDPVYIGKCESGIKTFFIKFFTI